jgi:uncharacterized protein YndB with AHSA1/START domain
MSNDVFGSLLAPDTVRIERLMPGPIERLWRYLTDSDKRSQWLAAGDMDLCPGGAVEHVFRNDTLSAPGDVAPPKYAQHGSHHVVHGQIIECDPPNRLSYQWGDGADPSEVSFELSPQGTKVRLVVTHRRLASRDGVLSVSAGWHAHLAILEARLAGTEPPSFWPLHTRLEGEYSARMGPAS